MTRDIRREWEDFRRSLIEDAGRSKQSHDIAAGLANAYARLGTAEREAVNELLSDWLLSDDIAARFDARVLAGTFRIPELAPALGELAERLSRDPSARARHELEAVRRILAELPRPS